MRIARPIILIFITISLYSFGQERPSVHQIQLEYYNNNNFDMEFSVYESLCIIILYMHLMEVTQKTKIKDIFNDLENTKKYKPHLQNLFGENIN